MTLKSVIGFGNYRDHMVYELMAINKHSVLIKMYYGLQKIDFDTECKKLLHITPDIQINKPGKNWGLYYKNIRRIVGELFDDMTTQEQHNTFQESIYNKKYVKRLHDIVDNKRNSKKKNSLRVQKYTN